MKLLAASAAVLTLAIAGSQDARAWCDEDCAYEMHEAAQEAAYERATERAYAREEAEEEGGYRYRSRGGDQRAARTVSKRSAQQKRASEPSAPKEASQPAPQKQSSKVASENSSITGGSTRIADDDSFGRPAAQRDVGCKTFFPATGMTLSVPCD